MTNINFLSNTYQTKQDPNVYAQQYATQNGISLEDAKEELKSKYGDPDQSGSIFSSSNNNFDYSEPDVSELENFDLEKPQEEASTSITDLVKNFFHNLGGNSDNTQSNSGSISDAIGGLRDKLGSNILENNPNAQEYNGTYSTVVGDSSYNDIMDSVKGKLGGLGLNIFQ